ncbi:TetR/AcrR family transcriptional regulator [Streptomyces sp. HNM0645]|uniref:TetR/AcrR family transcriptional regulator n=1 Tax=Streptomyces sp. HNM0645 TaxID=2782343 RepID=UPI0024B69A32|nr:TetR/AcrR family transcriptional regulator [Streptomyces sp. HNM0645]MDI9889308.1 TetR/AcrR family transcriptional regulator [Streptomyces sp. HNM0645]
MTRVGGRKRARPGEGARLRTELLAAAERILNTEGEDAVTVRGVAAAVGVTTPSVYLHFASRLELLHAVCLGAWDDLGRRMSDSASDVDDPFSALHRRCVTYIAFGLEHPLRYRLVMDSRATEASRQVAADCFRYLAEAVEPCVTAGALRGDVAELTRGICAGLHGAVALLAQQPPATWPHDLDAYAASTASSVAFGAAALGRLPDPSATPDCGTLADLFTTPSATGAASGPPISPTT